MTANEEKNELVVVDVPNVHIYAFTVSGWPTPRTAEEVLNAARKSTAESIQRITQIIESDERDEFTHRMIRPALIRRASCASIVD